MWPKSTYKYKNNKLKFHHWIENNIFIFIISFFNIIFYTVKRALSEIKSVNQEYNKHDTSEVIKKRGGKLTLNYNLSNSNSHLKKSNCKIS